MRWSLSISALLTAAGAMAPHVAGQIQPPQKLDVVSVTGCLTQGPGDTWVLTNATDPAPTNRTEKMATTTTPSTAATTMPPAAGKNRFKLIGILELNVPSHKGHTVTVKGILIPAQPEKRINLTSVQMVSATCSANGSTPPQK